MQNIWINGQNDQVYQMARPDKGVGGVYRGRSGATLETELTTTYLWVLLSYGADP